MSKRDLISKSEPKSSFVSIAQWPHKRRPEGLGISVKDGWNFGTGFGLAMAVAVPLILLLLVCLVGVGIVALGGSLGALL